MDVGNSGTRKGENAASLGAAFSFLLDRLRALDPPLKHGAIGLAPRLVPVATLEQSRGGLVCRSSASVELAPLAEVQLDRRVLYEHVCDSLITGEEHLSMGITFSNSGQTTRPPWCIFHA